MINAAPVIDPNGFVSGAITIIQDITPLEDVERLRNEFLGMVSHELKTPLTAIKGAASTFLGSPRPVDTLETKGLFRIIDEQSNRLRDLIDNLLDMTRIEAGALSVSQEPIPIREILKEALSTFVHSYGPREIQLDSPDDLPPANADRRRIVQVVTNLLNNAAKFSLHGAPISIKVEIAGPDGIAVHVKDQGRGIPREKKPYLFKKFSQVHQDSGPQLSGSGLGLAICKGIVEAHGGRIWVNSDGAGRGATFSFTIPIATEQPLTPAATPEVIGQPVVRRQGPHLRILAVDDEPSVLRYLQRILSESGFNMMATTEGSQAPGLVESERPDLVLMDLRLPGTNGIELLQRIREFSEVPVIFLTASDREEDAVRALRSGADDYMTKPFSPSELLARIEAALRRRRRPGSDEGRPTFTLGDLTINYVERRVMVGGSPVALSATEYKLLYCLATNAGRVLTHDQILHNVWGPDYSGDTELVRSFVRNLRQKLHDDVKHPSYVFTEPRVGYRMPKP